KQSEGEYKDGKPSGKWSHWDESGRAVAVGGKNGEEKGPKGTALLTIDLTQRSREDGTIETTVNGVADVSRTKLSEADAKLLAASLKEHTEGMKSCHAPAGGEGRLEVRLQVNPGGEVSAVAIGEDELGSQEFTDC